MNDYTSEKMNEKSCVSAAYRRTVQEKNRNEQSESAEANVNSANVNSARLCLFGEDLVGISLFKDTFIIIFGRRSYQFC